MARTDYTEWQCDLCQDTTLVVRGKKPVSWTDIAIYPAVNYSNDSTKRLTMCRHCIAQLPDNLRAELAAHTKSYGLGI